VQATITSWIRIQLLGWSAHTVIARLPDDKIAEALAWAVVGVRDFCSSIDGVRRAMENDEDC
jgi:hypothetical protein